MLSIVVVVNHPRRLVSNLVRAACSSALFAVVVRPEARLHLFAAGDVEVPECGRAVAQCGHCGGELAGFWVV